MIDILITIDNTSYNYNNILKLPYLSNNILYLSFNNNNISYSLSCDKISSLYNNIILLYLKHIKYTMNNIWNRISYIDNNDRIYLYIKIMIYKYSNNNDIHDIKSFIYYIDNIIHGNPIVYDTIITDYILNKLIYTYDEYNNMIKNSGENTFKEKSKSKILNEE